MSRTVSLTLTLRLEIDDELSNPEFYDRLPSLLRTGLGTMLPPAMNDVFVVSANDPDGVLSKPTNATSLFTSRGEVPFIWSIHDVRRVRPDLSDNEAFTVLEALQLGHDSNYGVTWDTISYAADTLFGESSVAPCPEAFARPLALSCSIH